MMRGMIMRPKSLAILGAGAAIAVAAAVIAGSTNAEIRTRVGVVPARAASNMPPSASITIRSLDDAIGFLNARDPEYQAGAGLSRAAIVRTAPILVFGDGLTNFARISDASIFQLTTPFLFGLPTFAVGATISMFIVMLVMCALDRASV